MAGRSRWEDGRRAWERLRHWWQYTPTKLTDESFGELSLKALEEVQLIRTLLDMAELNAVLTARLHGRSWVEIATRLGISAEEANGKWGQAEGRPED